VEAAVHLAPVSTNEPVTVPFAFVVPWRWISRTVSIVSSRSDVGRRRRSGPVGKTHQESKLRRAARLSISRFELDPTAKICEDFRCNYTQVSS
jgi:hypothetical protein